MGDMLVVEKNDSLFIGDLVVLEKQDEFHVSNSMNLPA